MINRVIIRGYVADDPLVRATERGKFVRLRVATVERILHSRDGVQREHTEWHTVDLWGEAAELADQQIRIGCAVELEGRLRTSEWEGRDGRLNRTCNIVADTLHRLPTIEGYELPAPIVERMEQLYPRRKKSTPESEVVTPPAEDPDGLPF